MPEVSQDKLHVNGIRCYGYTGFLPEENKLGQWFEVNLIFWLNLSDAVVSDDLGDCLDYRQVIDIVKMLIQREVFKTVERLAGAIADELLEIHQVERVQVRLTKLSPPIPNFSGSVTVEITQP